MAKTDLKQMFTDKQLQVLHQELHNPKWKLMINYGAVRAGKTFVDNFVFLFEVRHAALVAKQQGIAHPLYILAGVSSKSIYNNVLTEITNTFGLIFKFDKHNSFQLKFSGLPPVTIVQTFTGSISGLGAIRGMTATGAYVNEASLANEAVFTEIRQRCSVEGARVVCDTNPDVPTHWLKTKYIDNPNGSDTIVSNHFILDDNTFLNCDYVQSLKETTPTGMFYDRSVRGLWVAGEGLVYSDFDKDKNIITRDNFKQQTDGQALTYYAGVDWGFEHKGVIVVLADDDAGNTYLIKEVTRQHQQIEFWVDTAREVRAEFGYNIPFYCDSARPEYVTRFQNEGFNAINAYKIRLTGVELLAGQIKRHQFMVVKEAIDKFTDELYQYSWDEKTGEPVKENDDVMDATRYAKATKEWQREHTNKTNLNEQTTILQQHGLIDQDSDLPWM